MSGILKVKTGGIWREVSVSGPTGPQGATGPPGIATIIVGEFTTQLEADLPVDGAIPADWDGPGTFPGGKQMLVNEALINNNPASPTFGNLWQFVGVSNPAGWVNVGQVVGPPGADGVIAVRDTGFVEVFHSAPGMRPAGAIKLGQVVTIHGTMWMSNPVATSTSYLVGTVSVGFRPLQSVNFPVIWIEASPRVISAGYGNIRPDGGIYVVSPVAFTMLSEDTVNFNATYPLD